MPATRHVALLIEATNAYARGLLHGVAQYTHERRHWTIYFEPHALDEPPPKWLKNGKGDGILARIGNRRAANAVLAPGAPVAPCVPAGPPLPPKPPGPPPPFCPLTAPSNWRRSLIFSDSHGSSIEVVWRYAVLTGLVGSVMSMTRTP